MKFRTLAAIAGVALTWAAAVPAGAVPPGGAQGSYADGALRPQFEALGDRPRTSRATDIAHPRESLSFWVG